MRYMLDTNAVIHYMKKRSAHFCEIFRQRHDEGFCISTITLAELLYGVKNSSNPLRNYQALLRILMPLEILDFDSKAAEEYGWIKASLKRERQLIGEADLMIAAHAKSKKLVLVSNNTREFARVKGLELEDWV